MMPSTMNRGGRCSPLRRWSKRGRGSARQGDKETRRQGEEERSSVFMSPCLLVSLSPHLSSRRSPLSRRLLQRQQFTILPGSLVFNGLDMHGHLDTGQGRANGRLNSRRQLVGFLNAEPAGHKQMKIRKAPRARLPGAQGVKV